MMMMMMMMFDMMLVVAVGMAGTGTHRSSFMACICFTNATIPVGLSDNRILLGRCFFLVGWIDIHVHVPFRNFINGECETHGNVECCGKR